MKLRHLTKLIAGFDPVNQKNVQFIEDIQAHPEIGEMDVWDYLRSALHQDPCPNCIGRDVTSVGCNYCHQTGKVDRHLLSHPMNVFHIAQDMKGKKPE